MSQVATIDRRDRDGIYRLGMTQPPTIADLEALGICVGTVVRAFYANGIVQAQRYGSAANSQYSQGLVALHFGIPEATTIEPAPARSSRCLRHRLRARR